MAIENVRDELPLLEKFNDNHTHYKFPRFDEDPNVFEGLLIYWKDPREQDDDEV